jgi:hypothetical protein
VAAATLSSTFHGYDIVRQHLNWNCARKPYHEVMLDKKNWMSPLWLKMLLAMILPWSEEIRKQS